MLEPYEITNVTNVTHAMHSTANATDYNNTDYIYINEEFTQIVSISVVISFSFIFVVGLLGNSLVVMGEPIEVFYASHTLISLVYQQS